MNSSSIFLEQVSLLFEEATKTLANFMSKPTNFKQVELLSEKILQVIQRTNKIITCGNGGSMCDAMHFAEELTGRFQQNRQALPALSISDPSHLSCVANDFGFDYVFSRYIEGVGVADDLLVAFSTSGNSQNIVEAVLAAKKKQIASFCLLGKNGGKLAKLADDCIIVESQSSARIQEIHIKIVHIVIDLLENRLGVTN